MKPAPEVVKKRASDLHIQVGLPPMLRIDGSLTPVAGFNPLDEQQVETLIFAILDQDQQQILLKDKEFQLQLCVRIPRTFPCQRLS